MGNLLLTHLKMSVNNTKIRGMKREVYVCCIRNFYSIRVYTLLMLLVIVLLTLHLRML